MIKRDIFLALIAQGVPEEIAEAIAENAATPPPPPPPPPPQPKKAE